MARLTKYNKPGIEETTREDHRHRLYYSVAPPSLAVAPQNGPVSTEYANAIDPAVEFLFMRSHWSPHYGVLSVES